MGKISFIIGGARSGKSKFAVEYAKKEKTVLYIATYKKTDDKEMEQRIKIHRENRPGHWKVVEESIELGKVIKKYSKNFRTILIDCITLWISNMILVVKTYSAGKKSDEVLKATRDLMRTIHRTKCKFIIVSNEVGLGIVPHTKLGREFRDVAGNINQMIAQNSDEVYFMVAGIPIKIK